MSAELETFLDQLASDLGQQALLVGPDFEVLAYSRRQGEVDQVWIDTILSRRVPTAVRMWMLEHRMDRAATTARTDEAPRLNMMPRLMVPVRARHELLGGLWFIDRDRSLTDEHVQCAERAAPVVAEMLLKRRRAVTDTALTRQDTLRRLLLGSPEVSATAANELEQEQVFQRDTSLTLYVVEPVLADGTGAPPREEGENALRLALEQVRCALRSRRCGYFIDGAAGVFVAGDVAARDLAEKLRLACQTALGGGDVIVGQSGNGSLAMSRELLEQARRAVRVARSVARFRPIARWSELGVYQLLVTLAWEDHASEIVPRALHQLLAASGRSALLQTLECYLDNGGDAKATAAELALHRTSLYYRLERIEEIARVDVHDGEARLELHLGIRLARLLGIYPENERALAAGV